MTALSKVRHGPKPLAKKSRSGCLRCKARHVKCDESRPSCRACNRYLAECIYPSTTTNINQSRHATRSNQQSSAVVSISEALRCERPKYESCLDEPCEAAASVMIWPADTCLDGSDTPGAEAWEQKRWELRLMHNYLTNMTQPTPSSSDGLEEHFNWHSEISLMALEDDCILYGVLAHSALHLHRGFHIEGQGGQASARKDLHLRSLAYFAEALRLHQRAAGDFNHKTVETVCFGGLNILVHLFGLLQTMPISPWEPPLEWLRMGRGISKVFVMARPYIGSMPSNNRVTRFLNSLPFLDPEEMFARENRRELSWLIDSSDMVLPLPCLESTDEWDQELDDATTKQVYYRALSYVGYVRKMITRRDPAQHIRRAFLAFAIWLPEMFQIFLAQRRPRSMMILAYFFALWVRFEHLWTVGHAGRNQVLAIHGALPNRWRYKLQRVRDEFKI